MSFNNELDRSMHRYYEERAEEYDDWYDRRGRYHNPATNAAWHAQVAELGREAARFGGQLVQERQARVLDIACGTGKWSPLFLQSLPDDGRLVALDYSPAMLVQTRARLFDEEGEQASFAKISLVRGDAYKLPFPDSTFHLVFMGFWLSHVPRERIYPFLGEVKRVLKRGGNALIFDSALRPGVASEEIARRPLNDGSTHEVLKINYTPQELEQLLGRLFSHSSTRQTRDFFLIGQAGI